MGRLRLVEANLWWKMTFGGRLPFVEDDLWWKLTFGVRQPSVEDDLHASMQVCIDACCLVRFAAFYNTV